MVDVAEPLGGAAEIQRGERSFPEELLDELLPEELDWEGTVHDYPLTCLAVAAVAGFLLGRSSGRALLVAAAAIPPSIGCVQSPATSSAPTSTDRSPRPAGAAPAAG